MGKNRESETKTINKWEDLKKGRCRGLKEKCWRRKKSAVGRTPAFGRVGREYSPAFTIRETWRAKASKNSTLILVLLSLDYNIVSVLCLCHNLHYFSMQPLKNTLEIWMGNLGSWLKESKLKPWRNLSRICTQQNSMHKT